MQVTVAAPAPNEFVIYVPGPQGPKGDKGDTGTAAVDTAQTWTKAHTFAPDADFTPVTIKSNVSQTTDLMQWQNSAGTILANVTSSGAFRTTRGVSIVGVGAADGAHGGTGLLIRSNAPQVEFYDADGAAGSAGRRWWIHVNSGNFYVLLDRDDNNTWDAPHPLYITAGGLAFFGHDLSFNNTLNANGKRILATADNFLRINSGSEFAGGIWLGSSELKSSIDGNIFVGSNGGDAGNVEILAGGGTANNKRIVLDGATGNATFTGSVVAAQGGVGQRKSATFSADGWYRIASNAGDRAAAVFTVFDTTASRHNWVKFSVSRAYGTAPTVTILEASKYGTQTFSEIRVVDAGTYDPAYIEVYLLNTGGTTATDINTVMESNYWTTGWNLIDIVAGSVPTTPAGYKTYNYGIADKALIHSGQIHALSGFFTRASSAGVVPATIRGAASQTANLTEWQTSDGVTRAYINPTGNELMLSSGAGQGRVRSPSGWLVLNPHPNSNLYFGEPSDAAGIIFRRVVMNEDTARVPLMVRAAASQTADIQQWQNNAGTALAQVHADGTFRSSRLNARGSLMTGLGTNQQHFTDIASMEANNNLAGAYVLDTPIPRTASRMSRVRIWGYDYARAAVVDFTVVFYPYGGGNGPDGVAGQIINYKMIDVGTDGQNKYIGVNAAGKIAVVYGDTTSSNYYLRLSAEAWTTQGGHQAAWETGWAFTGPNTTANFGFAYAPINLGVSTAAPSNVVTLDGGQTIIGGKTFSATSRFNGDLQMGPSGTLYAASGTVLGTQYNILRNSAASVPVAVIQSTASQTANVTEWQDSGGAIMAAVKADGSLALNSSTNASRSIFTWAAGDNNWRIGMHSDNSGTRGVGAGFIRTYATSHVQYVTYSVGTNQGFAVGPGNGGQSSHLEIRANDGLAFFRNNLIVGGNAEIGAGINSTSYTANNLLRGPVARGNAYASQTYVTGGGTDLEWKVLATVTMGTGLYTANAWDVEVLDARGNHGQTHWQKSSYAISINRSGATADDNITQLVLGPNQNFVRVVRIDAATAEIQGRTPSNYRHVIFKVQPTNSNGSSWTLANPTALVNGNTTGTIALAQTTTSSITHWLPTTVINRLAVGSTAILGGAEFSVTSTSATTPATVIRGATSQSANLTEWQDSAGTVVAKITPAGYIAANGFTGGSSSNLGYGAATLELYEHQFAPRLSFHWGGAVASQISIESNGIIAIRNNPGTAYESFKALDVHAARDIYLPRGDMSPAISAGLGIRFITDSSLRTYNFDSQIFANNKHAGAPSVIIQGSSHTRSVTNKALAANVATLTTDVAHGFYVGHQVVVAGVDATFDGTYTIASIPSTTTFTYSLTAADVASVAATGTARSYTQVANLTQWRDERGNVMAALDRFGQTLIVGKLQFGYAGHDVNTYPGIVHAASTNKAATYALLNTAAGDTFINAATTKHIHFRISNSDRAGIHDAGMSVGQVGNAAGSSLYVTSRSTTQVTQVNRAVASQSADIQQWQNSAGTLLARVDNGGGFFVGAIHGRKSYSGVAWYGFKGGDNHITTVIEGVAAQTADLTQWRADDGTVLARVASDGTIYKGAQAVGGNAADTEIMAIMGAF